jgi:excinuclease UvrABC ATPase subunit
MSDFSVDKAILFLKSLKLSKSQEHITKKVMKNAVDRLEFLS